MSKLLEKLAVADAIIAVIKKVYAFEEPNADNWYDFVSIPIHCNNIVKVNYWNADATLEFETTDGESVNWCSFSISEMKNVLQVLNERFS